VDRAVPGVNAPPVLCHQLLRSGIGILGPQGSGKTQYLIGLLWMTL
jgi:hypothetical protein